MSDWKKEQKDNLNVVQNKNLLARTKPIFYWLD